MSNRWKSMSSCHHRTFEYGRARECRRGISRLAQWIIL